MKLWVKRVTIGLVSLLLLAVAGLFFGRGILLRRVADRKIGQLEQRMNLEIAYKELRFISLSEIELTGLSVVPPQRDTLLRLEQLRLQVDVLPLLQRKVSVRRVYTDRLNVSFVKKHGISNYDCLFRSRKRGDDIQVDTYRSDYAQEIKRLADILFRLLPENGEMRNTLFSGQRDSLVTSFYLPSMTIVDNHFEADIQVAEGRQKGSWNVSGFLEHDQRRVEGKLSGCLPSERIVLPYIGPHYQATVAFDSIAFSLAEHSGISGQRMLEGTASVAGLEVFHQALSPDTILLNRGRLDYTVFVEKQAFVLDSLSEVTFNELRFHPYVRLAKDGRWHLTASVHKTSFPSSQLFASLPSGLFRHARGLRTGFLPGAIQEALAYDLQVGRFARGGSTISMQLVKNIFLNRHKNIARKLEEALLVWLIENQRITSKERMYEVYLNIVEWGPLVYGVCEASRFYFDKEPSDLTVNEAIFLASIIPKPKHFRSVFNPDATLKENQTGYFELLAKRLLAKGVITAEQAEAVAPVIDVKGPARTYLLQDQTEE